MIFAILASDDPNLVEQTLTVLHDRLGLGTYLKLLDRKSKAIRIIAVKSLKTFDDVSALKLIMEKYEKEKDEEVRQVYRDTFWTLSQKK